MSSNEALPVVSNRTLTLLRRYLVQEMVDPHGAPGRGEVRGEDPAEQLPGPGHAADHAGPLAVREDRGVPGRRALDAADPVQRVPALEQLEVTGAQREALDQTLATPVEDGADVGEVLRVGRPDVRAVLEDA